MSHSTSKERMRQRNRRRVQAEVGEFPAVKLDVGSLKIPSSVPFINDAGILNLPGWEIKNEHGFVSFSDVSGLLVLATEEVYPSGPSLIEETWLHVSASRRSRVPNWDDMCRVKDVFIGPDREALQVHPPADEYVNLHPYVLHLWRNLDRRVMPDFRMPFLGGLVI